MPTKANDWAHHSASRSRRDFLRTGSLGLASLGLPSTLRADASPSAGADGAPTVRAKSVVVLFLYGAPSQMDTLDPKPAAPAEVRGEFGAISTSLPGVAASELLPNLARNLHRVCLVRSMSHTSNNHAVSVALSGLRESLPAIEGNGSDTRHQPYFGSVLEYLWRHQENEMGVSGIPLNMVLPWPLNNKTDPGRWQHHAAWLGRGYNPVVPLFIGKGSRELGDPSIKGSSPILTRFDPWDGVTADSTFGFDAAQLPAEVSHLRFRAREQLLNSIESPACFDSGAARAFMKNRDSAFAMLASPAIAEALDVTREPAKVRDAYGLTMFGQCALAARRLIETGVKVVTVFWDTWTDNNAAWDTHHNHHPRLKLGLCLKLDRILPTFLDDMESHGLLDDTVVLVISEHGRTPAISSGPGGGREHWAGAYWGMFFGAGIKTGQVIGATDRIGGYPVTRPIHPNDILATVYHLTGFDAETVRIPDRAGRPMSITEGRVVHELLA